MSQHDDDDIDALFAALDGNDNEEEVKKEPVNAPARKRKRKDSKQEYTMERGFRSWVVLQAYLIDTDQQDVVFDDEGEVDIDIATDEMKLMKEHAIRYKQEAEHASDRLKEKYVAIAEANGNEKLAIVLKRLWDGCVISSKRFLVTEDKPAVDFITGEDLPSKSFNQLIIIQPHLDTEKLSFQETCSTDNWHMLRLFWFFFNPCPITHIRLRQIKEKEEEEEGGNLLPCYDLKGLRKVPAKQRSKAHKDMERWVAMVNKFNEVQE